MGPPTLFTLPILRYMKTYGLTREQLAMVSVVQREWAARNPRATFKTPITVEDVLNSRIIAYPFRLLQCCLVTDGGGALILVAAERARDFPQSLPLAANRGPVYLLGTGENIETPMVSSTRHSRESGNLEPQGSCRSPWTPAFAGATKVNSVSRAFRVAGPTAFAEAGITHEDVDHLTIYDAPGSLPGAGFAHLPIYGLEDLGFVSRGEAGRFIADRNTAPDGKLPLNTNGGGLSYMHSGMYGMLALQESVRQLRGPAPAQIRGARISVCHGVGGMFAASGTIIMSNEPP
jgi:acetyl-CoA acetyltransferase